MDDWTPGVRVAIVGANDNMVYGLDAKNLRLLWKYVLDPSYYTLYTSLLHPLFAVHAPTYTRYTCIYTMYTPNAPLNTPNTP